MNIDNLEQWHFEMNERACNYLLDLVLKGQKKATSSSALAFQIEGEEFPKEGEMSVITDWEENPRCLVKTTKVRILKYNEMTFEIAKLEGEDDTLESWKRTHKCFFTEEGKELGYEFSEDMEIVFEEFEVVEVL